MLLESFLEMLKNIVFMDTVLDFSLLSERGCLLQQLISQESGFWNHPSFPLRKHSQCLELGWWITSLFLLSVVALPIIGSSSSPGMFTDPDCFCSIVNIRWRWYPMLIHSWMAAVWKHLLPMLFSWDHWIIIPGHHCFIQWVHHPKV